MLRVRCDGQVESLIEDSLRSTKINLLKNMSFDFEIDRDSIYSASTRVVVSYEVQISISVPGLSP